MTESTHPLDERVSRARRGDRDAFDSLFAEQASSLRLFLRHRMGRVRDHMESIDLVQDVYLQAFERFEQFRGESPRELLGWLFGIARHRLTDQARRQDARKRGGHREREDASLDRLPDRGPGPKTLAALRDESARLEAAFEELPDRDREVILLRHVEGRSAREAAAEMELTENALNVVFFRAMQRWRRLLES